MAEFPTYKEMGKKIAEEALDGFEYQGKTIREWVKIITKQEPKQVELEGDGYADGELVYDYGKCPSCGWQFEDGDKDWKEPYCCHCGQKLTWFDSAEANG